jgi:hypothetical protein
MTMRSYHIRIIFPDGSEYEPHTIGRDRQLNMFQIRKNAVVAAKKNKIESYKIRCNKTY